MSYSIKQLLNEIKINREDSERVDFDKSFLLPLSIVGITISFASIVVNTFFSFNFNLYIIPYITLLFFIFTYYLGRKEKFVKPVKWFFIVTVFIATNFVWYYNYGSQSYWFFLLILLYSYLIFMMSGRQLFVISVILVVDLGAMFFYEYMHPDALGDYVDSRTRIVDTYAAAFLFVTSAYILMSLTKRYYLIEYKKARESDKLKSSFLSNLTHEIRTPLNAITGFSEILADGGLTQKERLYYKSIIDSSSDSLLQLIDDVLDASLIESGEIKVEEKGFCLNDLILKLETTYNQTGQNTNKKGVEIKGEVPDEKVYIVSDATRINQTFVKLIDNAIKFTEKGFVIFGFIRENNQIHFYVSDSGIGIEKEYQEKIFSRFYKIENQIDVLYRGAGLGLYLSRKNVELMSGSIWVESEPGAGSTFHFVIPVPDVKVEINRTVSGENSKEELKSFAIPSLLIVEDDFASLALLTQLVAPSTKQLHVASRGKEAVDIYKENRDISLVLLDIQLPDINGFEVIKQLRYINPHVKVIAQTAYVSEKDKQLCFDAGFDGFLAKPIEKRKLFEMVNKIL